MQSHMNENSRFPSERDARSESLEDWDKKIRHESAIKGFYEETSRLQSHGLNLYSLLVTTIVFASGGAVTALLAIFSGSLIEGVGIPSPFNWVFRLFSASLIFALISAAFGVSAMVAALNAEGIDVESYPAERTRVPEFDFRQMDREMIANAAIGAAVLAFIGAASIALFSI